MGTQLESITNSRGRLAAPQEAVWLDTTEQYPGQFQNHLEAVYDTYHDAPRGRRHRPHTVRSDEMKALQAMERNSLSLPMTFGPFENIQF